MNFNCASNADLSASFGQLRTQGLSIQALLSFVQASIALSNIGIGTSLSSEPDCSNAISSPRIETPTTCLSTAPMAAPYTGSPSLSQHQMQTLLNIAAAQLRASQQQQQQQQQTMTSSLPTPGPNDCVGTMRDKAPIPLSGQQLFDALAPFLACPQQQQQVTSVSGAFSSLASPTPSAGTDFIIDNPSPLQLFLAQVVPQDQASEKDRSARRPSNLLQTHSPAEQVLGTLLDWLTSNASPTVPAAVMAPPAATMLNAAADVQSLSDNILQAAKRQKLHEHRAHEQRSAALNSPAAAALLFPQQSPQHQRVNHNGVGLRELLELLLRSLPQPGVLTPAQPEDRTKALLTAFLHQMLDPSLSQANDITESRPSQEAVAPTQPILLSVVSDAALAPTIMAVVPVDDAKKRRRGRSGSFPQKIHQMLQDLENQDRQDIASFVNCGKAFRVHRPQVFVKEVMPKYFKMGSFASFQRQLNLYNFTRISDGPFRGSYFHERFVEGQPLLSTTMKRKEAKQPHTKHAYPELPDAAVSDA